MAKYRETICKFYICKGSCEKGKEAEHKGLCQHCIKYEPKYHKKHENRKRKEIEKIRGKIHED